MFFGLAASFYVGLVTSVEVNVDFSQLGPTFDGLGGLSGGGGTSRLLYDYSEPQRSEVLDALFLPRQGGSLQILKVEIGGDAASTEATEASHMHTRDDQNYNRGYEWWLMTEAQKRNPNMLFYGLSWGVPAWVANSSTSCGIANQCNYYTQDNLDYHTNWVEGAKREHNLTINFVGIWNESPVSELSAYCTFRG